MTLFSYKNIYFYIAYFLTLRLFPKVKIGFPLTPVTTFLPADTGNPENDFHSSVYILDKFSTCYQYRPLVGLMFCR